VTAIFDYKLYLNFMQHSQSLCHFQQLQCFA